MVFMHCSFEFDFVGLICFVGLVIWFMNTVLGWVC